MIQSIKNGYMTTDTKGHAARIVRTADLYAVLSVADDRTTDDGSARRADVALTADKLRELAEMATSMANRIDGFSYAEDIEN